MSSHAQSTDMYDDQPFPYLVNTYRELTMISDMNLYAAFNAVRYVHQGGVLGDIVECGVWRGGCSALMAATSARHGSESRDIWLYDTFCGMAEPSEADVRHDGQPAGPIFNERLNPDGTSAWANGGSATEVEALMGSTGVPAEKVHLVVGKVEDTIPRVIPDSIAVLRLDTDWYESTMHELVHLWPRVSTGGVLIIDDYGWWRGSRRAVDEFFGGRELLNRIDPSGARLVVKR